MNVLFNYQVPVYTQRILELEQYSESHMLMATGTGKTVVSAHIARYYLEKGYRGLFLYNENEGLKQAENTFRTVIGNDISYSRFYGQDTKDWNADQAQMLFASFQSMNSIYGKWYTIFPKDHFHFIVIDESHHDQAPTYKEVIDYFIGKKLRMTATPSDDNAWDETEETITLPQAIANGWLSDVEYHLLSDGINNQKLKQIMAEILDEGRRISVKQLNETIFLQRRTNKEIAIIKRRSEGKQTMIFCENIAHAKHVAQSFKQGTVGVVHSKQTDTTNEKTLQSFRDKKIQFIVSVDKFNEAINIPDAEVVVFLRATDSKRVFFQQLGRGLRKTETKNKVIVLDFVANVERLVMVTELGKEIREEAKKLGHNLSKDIFDIHGKYYDLNFTETVFKDILRIIDSINSGFLSYEELKNAVVINGILSESEYRKLYSKKIGWHSTPDKFYPEWTNWYDFLGKEKPSFLSYSELQKEVQEAGIKSRSEYQLFYKDYKGWISNPVRKYKSEWKSWPHFFGKEKIEFLSYVDLRNEVQAEGIESRIQYAEAQKVRADWHSAPWEKYKDQFSSEDFFGKEKIEFLSYVDLRNEVQAEGISSRSQYKNFQKIRPSWPSNPWLMYKNQYSSEDFFGK